MTENKEIKFKKIWTVEVTEFKDGTINMARTNDGFSVIELLGITTQVQSHLLQLMTENQQKPDNVDVSSKNSPIIHKS